MTSNKSAVGCHIHEPPTSMTFSREALEARSSAGLFRFLSLISITLQILAIGLVTGNAMRHLQRRTEKLERGIAKLKDTASRYQADCICFPKGLSPAVGFPIMMYIALCVKCPLHGARFVLNDFFVYVAKWMREKQHRLVTDAQSSFSRGDRPEQYIKAYLASFPHDLFPGTEEREDVVERHFKIFLRLRDGTRIQVVENRFYRPYDSAPDPEAVRAHDAEWGLQTFRIMARLLSNRGRIFTPSSLYQDN